ncbi:acyl transferase 1 [Brachypodium distachyon]|uniref:Uncharacterized protein n=1 Tax=Brachypodium distachyon TaxID=15368 RepID=I1IMG0_BRADI|nr:acyl transferase 1 [Brachypodium distachyon]KQJ88886.1 hypothetical protein BRADI_4g21930v3 [Brachypodium distachyon]|eukprot:XP_003576147.1 acyl transferase 1 [Brachypodium distachyon]
MANFMARRRAPELVVPARATPRETKALSDIDNFPGLRFYLVTIEFFRANHSGSSMAVDPAKVVKAALAEALVYYYPIAGRLREVSGNKLVVDCTAEGVVFVEADAADVALEDLGRHPLLPPYPCADQLLCHGADQNGEVVGKPLAYFQVTRLKHGAFVVGLHICHTIIDGFGIGQFSNAIAELARGMAHPSVFPVWEREIVKARTPPCIRNDIYPGYHRKGYHGDDDLMLSTPAQDMVGRYFRFGPNEIAVLRRHVEASTRPCRCTNFELLTAFMWRCRTIALEYESGQYVRLVFASNARGKSKMPIPRGYYGNAFLRPMVEARVDDLCGKPLGYALGLVQKAKLSTTEEHFRSMVDMMAPLRTASCLAADRLAFHVSDTSRLGKDALDFGWAKSTGGGLAMIRKASHHMVCKSEDGEGTNLVSMLLPVPAMQRLAKEVSAWLGSKFIHSSM